MVRKNRQEKLDWAHKRSRIIDLYNMDGDWRRLASQLNVSQPTAYRWIREGDKPDGRGGAYNSKIKSMHEVAMCNFIETNPLITLSEIASLLAKRYQLNVSNSTIFRHLDAITYSLKRIRFEPERANTSDNKERRKVFVQELLAYQGRNYHILFMDETNLNIHISRSEGRSVKGTRCTVVAAGSKGANIHMIGCIGSVGLIHHEIKPGAFCRDDALEWMRTCLRKANDFYRKPVVVVLDNAPCHSRIEEILQEDEFKNHKILRLAPYSPMFNPIENVWSVVKADVKRNLVLNREELLSDELRGTLTIKEYRLQYLERAIARGNELIVPDLCCSCIAHIQGKIPAALTLEDMEF